MGPVFDYSQFSRKKQKQIIRLQMRISRLGKLLDDPDALSEDVFETKLDEFFTLMSQMEGQIAANIVSVPRDWLVDEAPDDIDWKKNGAFDWLRADKVEALKDAAVEARTPEAVSGN